MKEFNFLLKEIFGLCNENDHEDYIALQARLYPGAAVLSSVLSSFSRGLSQDDYRNGQQQV